MERTLQQFENVIDECKDIFSKKTKDYGTAWRILRTESLTDQILIKAQRIRSIEEKGKQKIEDDVKSEFIGILNYAVMALIQLDKGFAIGEDDVYMDTDEVIELYSKYLNQAKELMTNKNHDYGEAWREMRISSYTDIILMKIFRLKQIEDNKGKTLISEGPEGSYNDIINYSVFALIKLNELKDEQ